MDKAEQTQWHASCSGIWVTRAAYLTLGIVLSLNAAQTVAQDARVLPQGRSRLSFVLGQSGGISQTYNDAGKTESLTAAYNMPLNSATLAVFDQRMNQLMDFLRSDRNLRYDQSRRDSADHGIISSDDPTKPLLGEAFSRGFLSVDAQATRTQYMASYQYGVTDRLSLGFMVPIVRTQVKAIASITGNNTAADIAQGYAGLQGTARETLAMIAGASVDTLQEIITSLGYDRFEDTDTTGVGDVVLGGRFNYLNREARSGQWISSVQFGASLPTGRMSPPRELTRTHNGIGTVEASLGNISNFMPTSWLVLSHSFTYAYRLSSTRTMRVRSDPSDAIPDASDEEQIATQLGSRYWTALGAKVKFSKVLDLFGGYEWFWKRADRFQGSKSDRDYQYLSEKTESMLETASVSLTASSVTPFLQGKFPVPGELSLSFFVPTAGRNQVIAPYGLLEAAMYF